MRCCPRRSTYRPHVVQLLSNRCFVINRRNPGFLPSLGPLLDSRCVPSRWYASSVYDRCTIHDVLDLSCPVSLRVVMAFRLPRLRAESDDNFEKTIHILRVWPVDLMRVLVCNWLSTFLPEFLRSGSPGLANGTLTIDSASSDMMTRRSFMSRRRSRDSRSPCALSCPG
jgi:hypothetical protein